ncbi:class I SAM-dependent methyltransferase [Candidatus Pacearchaeota archaeon]|nr:class I SAM-dependent methyltransferase [Candidatus Pacearchaeota archaeon]
MLSALYILSSGSVLKLMFTKIIMKKQQIIWNSLYKEGLTWKKNSKIDQDIRNKSVLELGVGNGKTLKAILNKNPKQVVAIDISKEAINSIKFRKKNLSLITKDFLKFNTKDKFDMVFSHYFLNNFEEKERKEAVRRIKLLLNKNGIILFEDFMVGDLRHKGAEIEENTIEKQNGIICHFFTKNEIEKLFEGMGVESNEKIFNPVRGNKSVRRKIIKAKITKL